MENIPFLLIAFAVTKSLTFLPVLFTVSAVGFSIGFVSCEKPAFNKPINNMMRSIRVMLSI
jgi:hypothetical protein